MKIKEEWRDIADFEGLYQVSNFGRIKSLSRQRIGRGVGFRTTPQGILKPIKVGAYLGVSLCNCSKPQKRYVHRVVAEAFLPKVEGKNEINHKDGNKHNNYLSNLEWCNRSENGKHAFVMGLHKPVTPKNKKKVCLIDTTGNKVVFDSIAEAAKHLGVCESSISRACKGVIKQVKQTKVCFYEDKCNNPV